MREAVAVAIAFLALGAAVWIVGIGCEEGGAGLWPRAPAERPEPRAIEP